MASLPWLVAVGIAKLTFISALGLIAVDAMLRRLARRAEERAFVSETTANFDDR